MADSNSSSKPVVTPAQEALRRAVLLDSPIGIAQAIALGADINEPDRQGFTPAALGVILGSREALRFLLSRGADINKDGGEGSALRVAVHLGALDPKSPTVVEWREPEMLKLLLEEGEADVEQRAVEAFGGPTLLGQAVSMLAMKRAALLLQHGADVNAPVSEVSPGPLAVLLVTDERRDLERQLEMARLLLKHGARVDFPYTHGITAMHAAVAGLNACRKLELLLAEGQGARLAINAPMHDGTTPLKMAVIKAAAEQTLEMRKAVVLLLRHGATIDGNDPVLAKHLEFIAPGFLVFYQTVKGRSNTHEELAKFVEEHPGTKPDPDQHISLLTSGLLFLLPLGGRAMAAAAAATTTTTATARLAPEPKGPSPSPQPASIPRPLLAAPRPLRPSSSPSVRVLGLDLNSTLLRMATSRPAGRQLRVVGAAAAAAVAAMMKK